MMNHDGLWDIPATWTWSTMGAEAKIVGGGTPKKTESGNFEGGTIPWITPADLSGYRARTIARGSRNITEQGLNGSSAKLLPTGTVLFSSRAPIGYVAIAACPVATNQGFKSFVLDGRLDPEYVYYYLKFAKPIATELASGTTFLEISGRQAGKIPVPVPPHEDQREIVSALDSYFSRLDDAVANLERVQRNLKRYRASVLKAAVEGRLVPTEAELARAEGRDYEPASVLLERILAERRRRWEEAELEKMLAKGKPPKNDKWKAKYQEPAEPDLDGLPELPEGWGWATLPQLVTADGHFVDGDWVESKDQDPGGEVRLTQLADVGDGVWRDRSARFLTTRKAVELGCTLLEADDVLIARMPDPLGRACLFPGADRPCVTVVDVCIVRLDREYASPKWLFHALNAPSSRARVKALERGSTRKRISRNNLGTIPIAMPPRAEQASVAAEIERLLTIAERVQRDVAVQVERLASLRQGLLAAAFRGHLLMHNRVLTGTTR